MVHEGNVCFAVISKLEYIPTTFVVFCRVLDEGLEEPVASVIWASFRLQADVPELKVVVDQLRRKYGKEFVEFCQRNDYEAKINEKLLHKLGVEAPPKQLVEMYMEEIAKSYNVPFSPDQSVMSVDAMAVDNFLLDVDVKGGRGGGGGGLPVMEPQGPSQMPPPPGFIDPQVCSNIFRLCFASCFAGNQCALFVRLSSSSSSKDVLFVPE